MSMVKNIQLAAAVATNRSLALKGIRTHRLPNSPFRAHLNSTRQIATSNFQSSPSSFTSDSFHGLSLDEKVDSDQKNDGIINSRIDAGVQEAEVVRTEDDRQRTRDLIAELVRAEMLAYSSPKADDKIREGKSQALSPYEQQMAQLQRVLEQHSQISEGDSMEYSISCRNVGEMHYKMGQVEQSQEILLDGLQSLIENSPVGDEKEVRLLKAQIMHLLGACLARCGDFDDASSWYEESLKLKYDLLDGSSDSTCYHYEVGKTYNGLAALEIMSGGGNTNWEKASTLFRDAEKHYLHGYQQIVEKDTAYGWDDIPKETVGAMSPHLVQLVINVRSNMGELLRQQGRHSDAVELFQLALDLAQMDVTRMNESINDEPQHFGEDDPRPEERRNAVVELLVKIADCHVAYDNYDEAAASFERALISHVAFRKLAENKLSGSSEKLNLDTRLPTATTKTTSIPLDLANATTAEAAIRNNLAYALTRINQEKLALDQYEMALQIKRHIGGNNHVEVGRTLMEMGALLGGPMKDLAAALNCFKEALHIYRVQRDEIVQANSNREENSRQAFYDADLELDEINEHVQNASKNIALIEDALLQHKGGVSKPRRP